VCASLVRANLFCFLDFSEAAGGRRSANAKTQSSAWSRAADAVVRGRDRGAIKEVTDGFTCNGGASATRRAVARS
jgi:hypothetical protein